MHILTSSKSPLSQHQGGAPVALEGISHAARPSRLERVTAVAVLGVGRFSSYPVVPSTQIFHVQDSAIFY